MDDARVGVDLVDVPSFRTRFDGRDELLADVFTDGELAYCRGQQRPWTHLAARFAAKEAALKALTSGLTGGMRWRDLEVTRDPAGTPTLALHGATAAAFARHGLHVRSLSMAHTDSHAMAVVLVAMQ